MDEFDRLAIKTACDILTAYLERPGGQDPENVEMALQILERCRELWRHQSTRTPERERSAREVKFLPTPGVH